MFAVIRAGGKQYRVAAEDIIRIDRVDGKPGEVVAFGEVLMVGGDQPQVGAPMVAGATVAGEVLQHTRGDKVIAFKKRRRQNSRRKRGYRHEFSVIRITEILTDGAKPAQTPPARPQRAAKPKVEVSGEETAATEATAGKSTTKKSAKSGKSAKKSTTKSTKKPAKKPVKARAKKTDKPAPKGKKK